MLQLGSTSFSPPFKSLLCPCLLHPPHLAWLWAVPDAVSSSQDNVTLYKLSVELPPFVEFNLLLKQTGYGAFLFQRLTFFIFFSVLVRIPLPVYCTQSGPNERLNDIFGFFHRLRILHSLQNSLLSKLVVQYYLSLMSWLWVWAFYTVWGYTQWFCMVLALRWTAFWKVKA